MEADQDSANEARTQRPTRRTWTEEEDQKLRDLVGILGDDDWRAVALEMKDRDQKQCRERWLNQLQPEIKRGKLTKKEWKVVTTAQAKLGNRWKDIAHLVPGRSPNQLKNYWNAHIRAKERATEKGPQAEDAESGTTTTRPSRPPRAKRKRSSSGSSPLSSSPSSTGSGPIRKKKRASDEQPSSRKSDSSPSEGGGTKKSPGLLKLAELASSLSFEKDH